MLYRASSAACYVDNATNGKSDGCLLRDPRNDAIPTVYAGERLEKGREPPIATNYDKAIVTHNYHDVLDTAVNVVVEHTSSSYFI